MITRHEKFMIPDESKLHNFHVEVNWDPKDIKSNECKLLQFTFPNGDVAHVKKEHLIAILFAFGSPDEQRDMIPQKITPVRWYNTVITVKAKKDIYKGESMTFPLKLTIPEPAQEIIAKK